MASNLALPAGPEDPDFRIVIIGKSKTGKSATGNTLLQRNAFETSFSASCVTTACQKETGRFDGRTLAVVDTPDLFDTRKPEQEQRTEIINCICLSAPGPHVFLVVMQLNKITEEEQEAVKRIQQYFGEEAARYTMVVFTHGDDLEADGVSMETFLFKSPSLRTFISQCGGGYHVFNNRDRDPAQVKELLEKVKRMVLKGFTNETFRTAERTIEEEKQQSLRGNPGIDPEEARRRAETLNSFIQGGGSLSFQLTGTDVKAVLLAAGAVGAVGAVGILFVGALIKLLR